MRKAFWIAVSFAAFAAGGVCAAPVPAGTGDATPSDDNPVICRTMAPVVGTRLGGTRQCATQKEWDRIRRDAQKLLDNTQSHQPFGYTNSNDDIGSHSISPT